MDRTNVAPPPVDFHSIRKPLTDAIKALDELSASVDQTTYDRMQLVRYFLRCSVDRLDRLHS